VYWLVVSLPMYPTIYLSTQLPGQPYIYSSTVLSMNQTSTNLSHLYVQLSFLRPLAAVNGVMYSTEIVTHYDGRFSNSGDKNFSGKIFSLLLAIILKPRHW
jgi:hypothetical protein